MQDSSVPKSRTLSKYSIFFALLVSALYLWVYAQRPLTAEETGAAVGGLFGAFLLGYGAARLTSRASKSLLLSSLVFSFLFVLLSGVSLNNRLKNLEAFGEAERKIVSDFLQAIQLEGVQLVKEYSDGVVASGAETLLDPKRLSEDKGFMKSEEILAKMTALDSKYESDAKKYMESIEERMRGLSISVKAKEDMIKGYRESRAIKDKTTTEFFALEKQLLNNSKNVVSLLKKKEGTFKFNGETLQFEDNETLEEYNRYIVQIQDTATKLTNIGEQSEKDVAEALKKAKELLGK